MTRQSNAVIGLDSSRRLALGDASIAQWGAPSADASASASCPPASLPSRRTPTAASPAGAYPNVYLHIPASPFRANEIEQPRNVNEDGFVGELHFIEGHFRPMPAFDLPAMNREPGFACRSRMTDCLCRCAHEPEDRRSEKMRQVDSGDRQCSSKTAVIPAQCAPHRLACAYKL
jgi:hypothetical protein